MNDLTTKERKKTHDFATWYVSLLCLVINVLWVYFLYHSHYIQYANNDDFFMMAQTSGAYGEYSPFQMFSNYFYGVILSLLFRFFPIVNWMTFFYFLFCIASFSLLFLLFIKRSGVGMGMLVSISTLLMFTPYIYSNISFTKLAGFLALTGMVLLFDSFASEKIISCVFGCVLLILGFWNRPEAALMVLPFGLIYLWILWREYGEANASIYRKRIILVGVFVAVLIGSVFVDSYVYKHSDNMTAFNVRQDNLVDLRDYGMPDYYENETFYNSIGVSYTDYEMFLKGYYSDEEVFSNEVLNDICSIKESKYHVSKQKLIDCWKIFTEECCQYPLFIFGFILCITFCICSKNVLGFVLTFLISAGEIFCLIFTGRYPLRVLFIPMACCVIVALDRGLKEYSVGKNAKIAFAVLILCFSILNSDVQNYLAKNGYRYMKNESEELLTYINSHDNDLYVWDSMLAMTPYSPLDVLPKNAWKNIAFDFGWMVETPTNIRNIMRHTGGDANVYRASIEEGVYFIGDDNISLKRDYIRENYYDTVDYAIVSQIGGQNIWSFSEKKEISGYDDINWKISTIEKDLCCENFVSISGDLLEKSANKAFLVVEGNMNDEIHFYEMNLTGNSFQTSIPCDTWADENCVNISIAVDDGNGIIQSLNSIDGISL